MMGIQGNAMILPRSPSALHLQPSLPRALMGEPCPRAAGMDRAELERVPAPLAQNDIRWRKNWGKPNLKL